MAVFRLNYARCTCTDDITTLTLLKGCIDFCYSTRNTWRPRSFGLFSYFFKITRLSRAIFRCKIHRLHLSIAVTEIYSPVTLVSGLAVYIGRCDPVSVSNYLKITQKAGQQAGKRHFFAPSPKFLMYDFLQLEDVITQLSCCIQFMCKILIYIHVDRSRGYRFI